MKRLLLIIGSALLVAACVDTTGLSGQSSRLPKGNPQSSVVIWEFADLQCPSCKTAQTTIVQPLMDQYGSRISFEFKHYPLRSIHRYAMDAAQAAECAADQGKFWEFVDLNYLKQEDLGKEALQAWAKSLGLDTDLFSRCTRSGIKKETVLVDYKEGEKMGVTGTPTFFVNGQRVQSTLPAISEAIESILQGAVNRL